ncbi:hypothetical protein C9412_10150 [Stenotrophomonas sp. Nf1]|nr:hypothetical protein C9412_10150 [Stenotrophomonas sp. Nf1]
MRAGRILRGGQRVPLLRTGSAAARVAGSGRAARQPSIRGSAGRWPATRQCRRRSRVCRPAAGTTGQCAPEEFFVVASEYHFSAPDLLQQALPEVAAQPAIHQHAVVPAAGRQPCTANEDHGVAGQRPALPDCARVVG